MGQFGFQWTIIHNHHCHFSPSLSRTLTFELYLLPTGHNIGLKSGRSYNVFPCLHYVRKRLGKKYHRVFLWFHLTASRVFVMDANAIWRKLQWFSFPVYITFEKTWEISQSVSLIPSECPRVFAIDANAISQTHRERVPNQWKLFNGWSRASREIMEKAQGHRREIKKTWWNCSSPQDSEAYSVVG